MRRTAKKSVRMKKVSITDPQLSDVTCLDCGKPMHTGIIEYQNDVPFPMWGYACISCNGLHVYQKEDVE